MLEIKGVDRRGLPEEPREEVLKKRAIGIVDQVEKRASSLGWQGRSLNKGGKIETVLAGLRSRPLALLISQLEGYKDEKGEAFFTEKAEVLDSVLEDLLLVYVWGLGQKFEVHAAFWGEKPKEWESDYWQLAQAISSGYPSGGIPFVQLLDYSNQESNLFKRYLMNGENEQVDYFIGQPIESAKMGLAVKNLSKSSISPRQAIGLLIEQKGEETSK